MNTWYDRHQMEKKAQHVTQPTEGVLSIPSTEVLKEFKREQPEDYQRIFKALRGALEGGRINELLSRLERVDLDMYLELIEFLFAKFPKQNIFTDWLRGK